MTNIYVAGNLLLDEDNMPLKLLPKLKKIFPDISFIEFDPSENFPEESSMVIIDTVMGIENVTIFNGTDRIESQKPYSLHDFDLGLTLKLMKKAGKISDVTIIGVPQQIEENRALNELREVIKKIYVG